MTKEVCNIAIVVHIHYEDTLEVIARAIKSSPIYKRSDLFITLTPKAVDDGVKEQIRKLLPEATVDSFGNRGRDILPFLLLCKKHDLHNRYQAVLKLHGKHTKALPGYGAFWLLDSLNKLTPKGEDKILDAVNKHGVVGPTRQAFLYEPEHDNNHKHVKQIAERAGVDIDYESQQYFFGGSMLWLSAPIVGMLLSSVPLNKFPQEKGQYDGTIAHAVERLFTLLATNTTKTNPCGVDMSRSIFKELDETDISIDGLIREYEEFTNLAFVVNSAGRTYTLNYSELNDLQDKATMERLKSGSAASGVESPENLHTLLALAQEELALIKASKKYKLLDKYSKVRSKINIPRLH